MNLRDLMNKLDVIAEAPAQPAAAPVDAQRAAYDKFRADDAKKAAVDAVKKMTAPNGNSNYIDPKDGVIKYMDKQNGRSGGGEGSVKEFPYDWFKKGQEKPFFDQLAAAGLEVIPVERKQLFGTTQVAGVDLAKLATLGQEPVAPAPATPTQADPAQQAQADATSARVNGENIKKLTDLAYKLSITKGAVPAAKAAAPAAKGLTGGYPSAKEGIEFKSDIAKSLIESFGYDKLDEALPTWLPKAGQGIADAGSAIKNYFGGFGKGVSNPKSVNLPNVANGTNAASAGTRLGAKVATSPGKVAAGSALLGGGAAMLAANGGNQPATVEVPSVDAQPAVPPAPAPAPAGGPTPEQLEIIKQMQEIMKQLADVGTPEANQAISNAQEQISKITASPAQAAQDASNAQSDRDALDAAPAPATGKPGETNMAQTAATAPTAASIISNSPAVQASQGKPGETNMAQAGATAPVATNAASLKAAQDRAAGTMAEDAKTNESSDELARWLKIARGR